MGRKTFLTSGVLAALALLGFAIFTIFMNNDPVVNNNQVSPTPTTTPLSINDPNTNTNSQSGLYIDYSTENYETYANTERVLFFHAAWCPTCRVANEDFVQNSSQIPENTTVLKTDYDTESALKARYGITYQHTFVHIDAQGNEITKWNGGGVQELINKVT